MAKKMIEVGKDLILEVLKEIPLSKGEIGKVIGLGQGGFWRVTHVSGRMNESQWEKLKQLYFESTGKNQLPQVQVQQHPEILASLSLESLVEEIERRGWNVSISRKM